jgi:quinol monooxygenase YgiN
VGVAQAILSPAFPAKNLAKVVMVSKMSFHSIIRFEPLPGKEAAFRDEVLRVVESSRAETGCLNINLFESARSPFAFAIHSEWVDEAAFDRHASLPHTVRFLAAAQTLLTHPVQGLRLLHIGGGAGTGFGPDKST